MNALGLTQDLYCLDYDPVTDDDLLLPEGTLIRDPHRTGESELLGAEWRFHASTDGGRTWTEPSSAAELMMADGWGELGVRFHTWLHVRIACMKREEVLRVLSERQNDLRRKYGVKSLALFGSVARDEAAGTSDVDVLVELEGGATLFRLIELQLHLQALLGIPKVDVVMRDAIYPAIRDDILNEAIDVGPQKVALQSRAHS